MAGMSGKAVGMAGASSAWRPWRHGWAWRTVAIPPREKASSPGESPSPRTSPIRSSRPTCSSSSSSASRPSQTIAAKRIEHPTFPVSFEITNADVMVEGSELRGMVDVIARLDRDGQAGPAQPGDIEGRYAKNPTLSGGRDLEIVLDSVH